MRPRPHSLVTLLPVLGVAVWAMCAFVLPDASGAPVRALEVGGGLLLGVWAFVATGILLSDARAGRALDRRAISSDLGGVQVRVLPAGGSHAFVLGALRPRIYVGDALLTHLDGDEVRAVIRHEDHHRRTRAPLRAAALQAWGVILGPVGPARNAVADRLAALEIEADRAALAAGSSASTLARALLKADRLGVGGTSFASVADQRITWLVGRDRSGADAWRPALPYEWLPAAAFLLFVVACHAGPLF